MEPAANYNPESGDVVFRTFFNITFGWGPHHNLNIWTPFAYVWVTRPPQELNVPSIFFSDSGQHAAEPLLKQVYHRPWSLHCDAKEHPPLHGPKYLDLPTGWNFSLRWKVSLFSVRAVFFSACGQKRQFGAKISIEQTVYQHLNRLYWYRPLLSTSAS